MTKFVIFEKGVVNVKATMTKRGPRQGYRRIDPRTKEQPSILGMEEVKTISDEFVKLRNKIPEILQENFTLYAPEEIRKDGIKIFLAFDKNAGVGVKPDGEIVNFFSLKPGMGKFALTHAIAMGGKKLNCNDKKRLVEYYKSFGFVEVRREKNWVEGKEDVVWLELPKVKRGLMKSMYEKKSDWKEFCRVYEKHHPNDPPLTEDHREYLKTYLKGMDDVQKAWYMHAMRFWTKEDYATYEKVHLWMLGGELSEEDKKKIDREMKV